MRRVCITLNLAIFLTPVASFLS